MLLYKISYYNNMSIVSKEFINNLTREINTKQKKCRVYNGFYPQTNPIIYYLSQYDSKKGDYTEVFVNGYNFFPYGTTVVNFGKYKNIPVTFFSSLQISFVIPSNANSGCYSVNVSNIVNTYPSASLVYSNSENYCINP